MDPWEELFEGREWLIFGTLVGVVLEAATLKIFKQYLDEHLNHESVEGYRPSADK